jgi:hypothetical protein
MLDDLMKSAKDSLVDRLSNPFLFSFAASWCGWNYKFIMILMSENTISQTVELIETVAFQLPWSHPLLRGLLYPLATSALFLWVYPHPTRIAFAYLRRQMARQNELRKQIDRETIPSREELAAREALMDRQLQEMEMRVNQANEQTRQARESVGRLEVQLRNVRSETAPSLEVRAEADRQVAAASQRLEQTNERLGEVLASDTRHRRLFSRIFKEEGWPIDKLAKYLSPEQRHLLRILNDAGGIAEREALRLQSKLGDQAFRDDVQTLAWLDLVGELNRSSPNGTDRVQLMDAGRQVATTFEATGDR